MQIPPPVSELESLLISWFRCKDFYSISDVSVYLNSHIKNRKFKDEFIAESVRKLRTRFVCATWKKFQGISCCLYCLICLS